MSPRQRQCLDALATCEPGYGLYLDTIASRTGLTRREVRVAVRALARGGFTRLERWFEEGTGLTAGSGYEITARGRLMATPLDV